MKWFFLRTALCNVLNFVQRVVAYVVSYVHIEEQCVAWGASVPYHLFYFYGILCGTRCGTVYSILYGSLHVAVCNVLCCSVQFCVECSV